MSYSLVPPEDAPPATGEERVEPRMTVLPMERKPRFEEIAAPSRSEVAEHAGAGARLDVDDRVVQPSDIGGRKPVRRGPRIITLVGLGALLVGFGVLAATFGKAVTGNSVVTQAPAVDSTEVALAPPPPATDVTAGPGVRVIPPSGEVPAPGTTGDASAAMAPDATAPVAEAPAEKPPLPRLRPTSEPGEVAMLPPPQPAPAETAPAARAPAATAPAPAATAAAPAEDDVGALMANVDRLLAQRKAAAQEAALNEPLTDSGIGLMGGAAPTLIAALPGQPLPVSPLQGQSLMLPGDLPDDGTPVPPADIPNPGN